MAPKICETEVLQETGVPTFSLSILCCYPTLCLLSQLLTSTQYPITRASNVYKCNFGLICLSFYLKCQKGHPYS